MAAPKRALFLIRTAMITGVLAFAVAVIVTRRQGAVTAATDRAASLRMMAQVAALVELNSASEVLGVITTTTIISWNDSV